ncbi:MAG TPA: methenyltetrahydromethanopterin cyclohydrolase [Symbiobacteriaceae bacterium]|nr:methenyltetrahydromethanopterin cyclohydrolase [Symbiobacteriaceae bacterium]
MGQAFRLNHHAAVMVQEMVAKADALGVQVLPGLPAQVLDCGVQAPGGYEAGCRFASVTMGGLGRITLVPWQAGMLTLPGVQVITDQPAVACLGAQYAGWAIRNEGFFAMGSGPARALARVEKLYQSLPVSEESGEAVLCLEGRKLPDQGVLGHIASACGVAPDRLAVLIAPTASVVGSVQVSARVVETALHKLHELGFDVAAVRHGWGIAPLSPVAGDDLRAIGRTNDCLLYGGLVHLTVDVPDEVLADLAPRVPASASGDYGRPFYEVYRQYGDFYKIDPLLFSPAQVSLVSLRSGRVFTAGALNPAVLQASFGEG